MKMITKMVRKRSMTATCLILGLSLFSQDHVGAAEHKTKKSKSDAVDIVTEMPAVPNKAGDTGAGVTQKTYMLSLKQLGVDQPIELRGIEGERSFSFSVRSDEVITAAKVKYGLAYSPALLPDLSHLKVAVNGELVSVVPLPRETANGIVREDVIDPRVFADFNQLSFKLIGHYTRDCEDPFHSSLWAKLSNTSYLELTVSPIVLQNDLSMLPVPFFDKRDSKMLELPFVLPQSPSNEILKSAGAVASWFGNLASYRGSKFPVASANFPKGNAVVFATSSEVPAGVQLPNIAGPTLTIVENPSNPNAKLLMVLGRNAAELKIATQALTLGQLALAGDRAVIKDLKEVKQRHPYDAPNWIPTDRPVKFGELVSEQFLQVAGLTPDLIRVNMRVSPDLFTWQKDGVPIDLRYRFTPRPTQDKSTLNIGINGEFVRSLSLSGAEIEKGKIKESVMLFFKEGQHYIAKDEVQVPAFQIGAENQLQFHFYYDYPKQGPCKDVYLDNVRSAIDPDSTIDFSHMPHYAALPNLGYFANSGFPNTRMADLSDTAIVVADRPNPQEIEVFLNLMGRMGESTGYPTLEANVIRTADVDKNGDKDFIIIGTNGNVRLLKDWAKYMPMSLDDNGNKLQLPTGFMRVLARWAGRDLDEIERHAGEMLVSSGNNFGAMMQFESPLSAHHSVVVVTAGDPGSLLGLTNALLKPDLRSKFQGDLVLVKGDKVENALIGDTYHVGSLPWWTAVKWHLSNQPLVLIVLLILASLIVATMLFRFLRRRAAERLALGEKNKI